MFAGKIKLGEFLMECRQFDGGLALVRVRDAASELFRIIGENLDALTATRN